MFGDNDDDGAAIGGAGGGNDGSSGLFGGGGGSSAPSLRSGASSGLFGGELALVGHAQSASPVVGNPLTALRAPCAGFYQMAKATTRVDQI